jgi:hypothetical protein
MYEIYSRKDPYDGENPRRVLSKVCDPRINHRPPVPRTCPKKMAELMRKCWSGDPLFRPESKDLDLTFGNMNVNDAEPILEEGNTRLRKEVAMGDMMYQVFPRKVADMLKAGQKVEPYVSIVHLSSWVLYGSFVSDSFPSFFYVQRDARQCNCIFQRYHPFHGYLTRPIACEGLQHVGPSLRCV